MNTLNVDFLFKGSHPAFYWAAALLKKKGKSVAIIQDNAFHSWELFPSEVINILGLEPSDSDRDVNPIQLLTSKCRMSIFDQLDLTKKDKALSVGSEPSPEMNRGLAFYSKGSDYPVVYGESSSELIEAVHHMVYFEKPKGEIQLKVTNHLTKMGVLFLKSDQNIPTAEQIVNLDLTRAKVFRTITEFKVPMKKLPVGASNRMLFIERNSPLIEMIFKEEALHLRCLLENEPLLIHKILNTIGPYFTHEKIDEKMVVLSPRSIEHDEWISHKKNVEIAKNGSWLISPAISPELGERSLYVRISELLSKKFKKQQVFENKELFSI